MSDELSMFQQVKDAYLGSNEDVTEADVQSLLKPVLEGITAAASRGEKEAWWTADTCSNRNRALAYKVVQWLQAEGFQVDALTGTFSTTYMQRYRIYGWADD